MTNQHLLHPDEAKPDDNLIQLENETRAVGQAKDINVKINLLEGSLDALQSELQIISNTVAEGLEHLRDSDLDLTSKVAETYKRLGDIDGTYKALTVISENIDSEVKKLTEEITGVAAQSAAELEEQNTQFSEQHEQLVQRVNELVGHSQETSAQLSQNIRQNTDALVKLEKELVAEIESLANTTNQRSDDIEQEVESSKARILQLQEVDKALEKRAASLETSAAELTQRSEKLRTTVELLDMRTDELSAMIDRLLEAGEKHATLLGTLQEKSVDMAMSLKALTRTENRHFRMLSGFMLVAMLAIAGLYIYQQSALKQDAVVSAQRTDVVDRHLSGLQQETLKSASTLAEVQDNLVALNNTLENEVTALNERLQALDDQTQTLDGRISSLASHSRIGRNNVIRGPQWLAQQPAEHYALQVARVSNKQDLYSIAQRYNRYLTDELSYYTLRKDGSASYVLLSGAYASERDAVAVKSRLPRYVNFQRPAVIRLAEVQQRL